MQCPQCQADNREGRDFCAACGAPLGGVTCDACGGNNALGDKIDAALGSLE